MQIISRYKATLLVFILVVSLGGIVNAQRKTKRLRHSRRPIGTGYVLTSWEPEEGSVFYKFTKALPKVNKVEVNQIQGVRAGEIPGNVILVSGKERVQILAAKTLLNDEAENLAKIWRGQKRGNGAGCFAPGYLLRFYSDDQLLMETVICFHCHNLTLSDSDSHWGFDADGKNGQELLNALKSLLPPMA